MHFRKLLKASLFAIAIGPIGAAQADTISFEYTGGVQQWVAPSNVHSVEIRAWGAQGQSNAGGVSGGLGGFSTGTLAVTPGDLLSIFVGGGGISSMLGGWNGGGNAGTGFSGALGGGGGGASDVRIGGVDLINRIIVAAGGGGAGGNRVAGGGRGTGGGGGGGYYGGGGGAAWPYQSLTLPQGGTQTAGGSAGLSSWNFVSGNDGSAGSLGQGGTGGNEVNSNQAGSGTALQGGAGGGLEGQPGQYNINWTGQSGAGGSSFLGSLTDASMIAGNRRGNGFIEFEFEIIEQIPVPTTLALLGLGLVGLGWSRRKKA